MGWNAYHRRRETVREALMRADGSHESAGQVLAACDPGGEVFSTTTQFLRDVQMKWFQNLSGELDRSRYLGSRDLTILVAHAWAQTAADMPGARRLLDNAADDPDLTKAFAKEDELLTYSAGIGATPAAEHANSIRQIARDMHTPPRWSENKPRPGILARVREAFAA